MAKNLKGFRILLRQIANYLFWESFNFRLLELERKVGQAQMLSARAGRHTYVDLWDAEVQVMSQWGEDGILDYLCDIAGVTKPRILEIGAGNFSECNSKFLVSNRNASAYLVDINEELTENVNKSSLKWKTHLFSDISWVTPSNVEEICRRAESALGGDIDVLSLDLDGNDYWVLKEIPLSTFRVIVLEYNPLFGHKFAVAVPRDDLFSRTQKHYSNLYWGASIKAYVDHLSENNFVFVGTNRAMNNAFFLHKTTSVNFPLKLPSDLSKYVDWRVRESRDFTGAKSFLSKEESLLLISSLRVDNLETGEAFRVGQLE